LEKEHFINAFYSVRNGNIAALPSLIRDIETHLAEEGSDIQLELIVHTLRTYEEDTTTGDFIRSCEATAPIIKVLHNVEWGLLELEILVSVIGHIASFQLTVKLMKKALSILGKKFTDVKHYDFMKLQIFFNLTLRLLRAKYFDKNNLEEVKALFDQCVKAAIDICDKKGYITFKAVVVVRNAVFYGVYNDILSGIKALEDTKDEAWIKTTKDEVVEYVFHIDSDNKLSTQMLNFCVGHQIQRRRKEIGMSTLDFADAIGSTQTAVNEFERGARGVSAKRLCDIAKVLDVDVSYLFGDVKRPTDVVADIKAHTINKLVSNMCDADKQYVLELVRGFIKYGKARK